MEALHRILQHSGGVASADVIVDANDADAVSFYKRYGFLELPDVERRLFLPMGTVDELFR
jgi:ribosomal protein S18 acetylase RimI-like enzyme